MSQLSSSILSNDNSQTKYKKALLQIQKISNANKLLKTQFDQTKIEYENKINKILASFDQISKNKQQLQKEKNRLQKLCEDLQASKSELNKEITYLSNILTEQNSQIAKAKAMKDDKALSALIISYENRQKQYRKDINSHQQLLRSMKHSYQKLEKQLNQERRLRLQFEQASTNLKNQINQYRDLNLSLLSKNENIIAMMVNRANQGKEKYLQTEMVLGELSKQLQIIKNAKIQQESLYNMTVSRASYENILQEKNKIQKQLSQLKQKIHQQQNRSISLLSVQQKLKKANIVAEQLSQQNNMLKNKITIIQTKNIMKDFADENIQLKQYQNNLVNFGDKEPLTLIKNSSQPSHFQMMKSYIIELKEKLFINNKQKKQVQKKYHSIREKIGEWTQKILAFEQQDKFLRGKLEGFERLTQRLQFQLQKNMHIYEQEMANMKQTTASVLNKRAEQIKAANLFFRSQLDQQRDKAQKTQKKLLQEIQILKQQINSQKIKASDLQDKYQRANEFLNIYKKKFNKGYIDSQEADKSSKLMSDNIFRYEQLYREEQAKNQSLMETKISLTNKINQLNNQLRHKLQLENQIEQIRQNKQAQMQQLKQELIQAKKQLQNFKEKLKNVKKQIEQKNKAPRTSHLQSSKIQHNLNNDNYMQNQKNLQLQNELQTLKLHLDRSIIQSQRLQSLQASINAKNDEINNLKKKIIALQKQNTAFQSQIKHQTQELQILKQENNKLKSTLAKNTQQLKRSSEFWETQNQKNIQKLQQQLANLNWQLRQERKTSSRVQYDLQSCQSQIKRLQQFIDQNKKKDLATFEEVNQLRTSYDGACQENERLKSQIKFKKNLQQNLNTQINRLQQNIDKLNQQNSQLRSKIQQGDNNISQIQRQLNSLRNYLSDVQDFVDKRLPSDSWQQQRDKDNLNNLISRIKDIIWENQSSPKIKVQYYKSPNYSTSPSKQQNNTKSYEQNVVNQWLPHYDIRPSNFLSIDNNGSKYYKNLDYY